MSGAPAPMNQFMTDEYVLAYHGPLLYEARVSTPTSIFTPPSRFSTSLRPVCDMLLDVG